MKSVVISKYIPRFLRSPMVGLEIKNFQATAGKEIGLKEFTFTGILEYLQPMLTKLGMTILDENSILILRSPVLVCDIIKILHQSIT